MPHVLPDQHRRAAEAARGFMPPAEGEALFATAAAYSSVGPILEVGTYCGKSTIYLAAAAEQTGQVVLTVDHHRGSEENQPGWEYHDAELVDRQSGSWTPCRGSGPRSPRPVSSSMIASGQVGSRGEALARAARHVVHRRGHTDAAATGDYEGWAPRISRGGALAIHDVFPNPADGGQPPYRVYLRALASGAFKEVAVYGSLRVLERTGDGI
jgi:hypothetical protein